MKTEKSLSTKIKDYVKTNLFVEPYRLSESRVPQTGHVIYSVHFKSNKKNSYLTIASNRNESEELDLMVSYLSADIQIDFEKIYNTGLYKKYKSWSHLIKNQELDLVDYLSLIQVYDISLDNDKNFNPEVTYRINYRDTVTDEKDGRENKITIRDEYIYISEYNNKVIFRSVNHDYYDIQDEDESIVKIFDDKDEAEKFLFISLLEFVHFSKMNIIFADQISIEEFKKCKTINEMIDLYKKFIEVQDMINI